MHRPNADHAARLAAHYDVATRLSLRSDRQLAELIAEAAPLGAGIGGRSAELELDGTRVFVKRVPVTDLELRPEHLRSTANLFGLPLGYQYGVGSSGFGVWRELAAHVMTTHWVLGGECGSFPLMYHWRVLPDTPPEGFVDFLDGIDGAVAHWDGSAAVRARLEAIGAASHSLVLFLEHVPRTLAEWLHERDAQGSAEGGGSPFPWAEEELARTTAFLRSRGFAHFDAHFANLLTDGGRIYFADFGLALSADFDLSPAERAFLAEHLHYDRHHTASHLLRHHLVPGLRGDTEATDFLPDWVAGRRPEGVAPELAALLDRHAAPTLVLENFRRRLLGESKQTPFPAAELARAAETEGVAVP